MQAVTLAEIRRLKNEPLSTYTFTKTGGPADELAFPENIAEVQCLLAYAKAQQLPVTIIGNASNLIVKDGGIRGLVIILTAMKTIAVAGDRVTAEAGARLIDTTEAAYGAGLTGMEFAAGIPGSIGGAVFMNAGAYGGEICDCLESATVVTAGGELKTYSNAQLQFSYRHSLIQTGDDVVVSATFALHAGDKIAIRTQMDELNQRRRDKQPLEYPSCGSVFKRPVGHYVGPLIQKAGLQGRQIGGAQISEKHAGFIVNRGGATATDYLSVIRLVQKVVAEKFDVQLEPEVRIIGED